MGQAITLQRLPFSESSAIVTPFSTQSLRLATTHLNNYADRVLKQCGVRPSVCLSGGNARSSSSKAVHRGGRYASPPSYVAGRVNIGPTAARSNVLVDAVETIGTHSARKLILIYRPTEGGRLSRPRHCS